MICDHLPSQIVQPLPMDGLVPKLTTECLSFRLYYLKISRSCRTEFHELSGITRRHFKFQQISRKSRSAYTMLYDGQKRLEKPGVDQTK